VSTQVEAPPQKRKRGRETALDMVRSLGLVILIIVPVWYLAQPPGAEQSGVREVDPAADIAAFTADAPGAPVPGELPAGWRPNNTTYDGGASSLRIGYVTPQDQYAEYSAAQAGGEDFVRTTVGRDAQQLDPVSVGGARWERYRDEDGSLSLVRSYGDTTVVVGTVRATATLEELEVLLLSLSPR
jgi:hypothetical protein